MNVHTLFKTVLLFLALGLFVAESADAQRNRRGSEEQKKEVLYPDATRAEPKIKQSQRAQRDMQKVLKAHEEEKFSDVITLGESLIANKSAGAYERAVAYQLIGIARTEQDDYLGATEAFQKAIAEDALDNNGHYQLMLQVAQMQMQEDQFEQAIATLERMLAETRSQDPQILALTGSALYQLERYDEAATYMRRAIDGSASPSDNWS